MARKTTPPIERPPWAAAMRARRKAAGLSQDALAAEIGLTQAAIADWETGKTTPRKAETITRLALALNCEPNEISPHTFGGFAEDEAGAGYLLDDHDEQFGRLLAALERAIRQHDASVPLALVAKWARRIWRHAGGSDRKPPDLDMLKALIADQVHVVESTAAGKNNRTGR